jgi:hypothetical protein
MVAFIFEIVKIHNDIEWCVKLVPMRALVLVSTSHPTFNNLIILLLF